ncbi:STAS domain-containing protein [Desulfovibrio mangrovi]|uniref:STAS domain-containing protein n=1 Tax=Desulfovibrio mangrovi TaxID=2976983 RepID=UPI00224614B6|nr:STAS domain-containing protein [Desulfovibrio mangrovi]UZP68170.1 STAS domain-containing protein [Desulfovibrio mangrovi]
MPEALLEQFYRHSANLVNELEPYLLELEVTDEQADSELLGRILRVLTSVRTGAALLDAELLYRLARLLEIVLERMRSSSLPLTHEAVRTVLRGCSVLSAVAAGEETSKYEGAVSSLEAFAIKDLSSADVFELRHPILLADGRQIMLLSDYELEQCSGSETFLYILIFNLQTDIASKDITPIDVLEFLQKSGHVVATHCECDLAASVCCGTDAQGMLYVLFSSILERDLVEAVFMLEERQIQPIDVTQLLAGAVALPEREGDSATDDDMFNQPVTDAPMEGLDALMAEYDRAMNELREASKVPFEPWDSSDIPTATFMTPSDTQDIFDSIVDEVEATVLQREAPPTGLSVGHDERHDPFDDLAPVDELLDGESSEVSASPDAGSPSSDDSDALLEELLGGSSVDSSGMASSIAHAAGDLFVQGDIDAVLAADVWQAEEGDEEAIVVDAEVLTVDDDGLRQAGGELHVALAEDFADEEELSVEGEMMQTVSFAAEEADADVSRNDNELIAAPETFGFVAMDTQEASGAVEDGAVAAGYDEVDSDQSQLAALEAEFEAALLEEARAAGIVVPDDDPQLAELDTLSMNHADTEMAVFDESGSYSALPDGEHAPEDGMITDPDADLFMDSGATPDLSYLDLPSREANDGGIVLSMDDQGEKLHGFPVSVDASGVVVDLSGDMTIASAERLRDLLLDLLQEHAVVELDMSGTDVVDVTFIQILVAGARFAQGHGVQLKIKPGASSTVMDTFEQCGLNKEVRERLSLTSVFFQ